jgi:hypothetical protein
MEPKDKKSGFQKFSALERREPNPKPRELEDYKHQTRLLS